MTLKYSNLALFDEQTLEDTRQNWTAFAGSHSVFALECGPIFDWMEERLGEEKTLETVAYGLFESGYTTAAAIVEVVNSAKTKGPMIKMLKVLVSPQFWDTVANRQEVLNIFIGAIAGCVNLSVKKKTKILKLYGRTNELLSVMMDIHTRLVSSPINGISATIEGRWLVLEG